MFGVLRKRYVKYRKMGPVLDGHPNLEYFNRCSVAKCVAEVNRMLAILVCIGLKRMFASCRILFYGDPRI